MTAPLAVFTTLYAAMLGLWALIAAALRRPLPPAVLAGVALLELTLLVQAAADVVSLAAGHDPGSLATHLGYLLASVLLLPLLVLLTRPPSASGARTQPAEHVWSSAVLAVACCATAVVVVRLWTTWQS